MVKFVKFLVHINSEHPQKAMSLMFEIETVGPFLAQKLKWGDHATPTPQRLCPCTLV